MKEETHHLTTQFPEYFSFSSTLEAHHGVIYWRGINYSRKMPLSNIYLAPTWQISAQILCINNNLNSFGPYFGHDSWSSFRLEALPQGQQKKEIQILSIWIYSKRRLTHYTLFSTKINKFISSTTISLLTNLYAAFTEILAEISTNIGGHRT